MPEYARVEGDAVIERRDMDPPPPHKAHLWRPIVYEGEGVNRQIIIEADKVRIVMSPIPLDSVKARLKAAIDQQAETARLKYITGGATKAMEYLEAKDQAVAVLQMGQDAANALPDNGAAQFPVLAASVPIEASTLYAAAVLVSGRYEQYASLAGQIKRAAVAAKASVVAAATEEQARAVVSALQWP